MWYEINVSLNGRHLFATHERSITDHFTLKTVYKIFKEKFPSSEGYNITVTDYRTTGSVLNLNQLDNLI